MIFKQSLAILIMALWLGACSGPPKVVLETDLGSIEIEVYEDKAPISAADFLYYVDQGLYNGEGFYRVVRPDNDPRQMGMTLIQGGLLSLAPVTQTIEHESTQNNGLSHTDGMISIARDAPGTGSAAFFFITIGDNSFLDYGGERNADGQGYAVFGKVTSGMDVVRSINALQASQNGGQAVTSGQYLAEPVTIKSARRK